MSNLIRKQLLAHGSVRPAIRTSGKADSDAVKSRKHEFVGRKAAKACSILQDAVRQAKREENEQRRDARQWR